MRTSTLLFLLLVNSPILVCAQSIWPDSNATWLVERTMSHGLLLPDPTDPLAMLVVNGILTTQIHYELGDQVTINNLSYTELWQNYESTFESLSSAIVDTTVNYPLLAVPELRGAFRSDPSKVFFIGVGSSSEQLLYDFDLEVGDTVSQSYINQNPLLATVSSIDTVLINGQTHRRFLLAGPGIYGDALIEGVGNENGPIQSLGLGIDIDHRLVCHHLNSVAAYPLNGNGCGAVNTGIDDLPKQNRSIVYPNPASDIVEVQTVSGNKIVRARLYNTYGQLLRDIVPHSFPFQIRRGELSDGLYFVQLHFAGRRTETLQLIFR